MNDGVNLLQVVKRDTVDVFDSVSRFEVCSQRDLCSVRPIPRGSILGSDLVEIPIDAVDRDAQRVAIDWQSGIGSEHRSTRDAERDAITGDER